MWKEKSRQTKTEMARPGERGCGKKPDDNRDGRRHTPLACHHSSRHTAKCRGRKVRRGQETVRARCWREFAKNMSFYALPLIVLSPC